MNAQPTSPYQFTLVLPLYNEGGGLAIQLGYIYRTLCNGAFRFQMILIDDCSTDETTHIAHAFAQGKDSVLVVRHEKNQGRGATVMDGFMRATSDVVGFMDVDCEVSPVYLLEFVSDLLEGTTDIITGHRIYKFSVSRMPRTIASIGYRMIVRALLDIKFKDTETGYKLFRRTSFLRIAPYLKEKGWFWDTEVMAIANLAKLRVEERPVLFIRNVAKRSSVHLVSDTLTYFKSLMRFRVRRKSLVKELAL